MSWIKKQINPNNTIYIPKNPEKFIGTHAVCRSSWERKFCSWCDNNPNVILWASESIRILYYDVTQRKQRSYYPDFMVKIKMKNGDINSYIIEIKPSKECKRPIRKNKKEETYIKECITYARNMAKWNAAIEYCKKNGIEFKVITEKSLKL